MAGLPLEIERKFWVRAFDLEGLWRLGPVRSAALEQTYLIGGDGRSERVRAEHEGNQLCYTHTRKRSLGPGTREEEERHIDARTYTRLLRRADPQRRPLRKIRHRFAWDGLTWELDVLSAPIQLFLLEVELPSLERAIILPPCVEIIREVTDDPAFSNAALAARLDRPECLPILSP